MAAFDDALAFVLKREGGYVDNPADRGGATNKGITTSVYDAYRRAKGQAIQSVARISDAEVRDIYYRQYWLASAADRQAYPMALSLFDAAVHHGVGAALELLRASGGSVERFLQLREQKFRSIVANNPTQAQFLTGWLTRLAAVRDTVTSGPGSSVMAGLGIIAALALVGAMLRRGT